MADRYWVGGTGPWNATSTANWSATSGGASGASAPAAGDNVIFNSASSATSYVVTPTSAAFCKDFTVAGPASGTVTFAGTGLPRVAGSVLFSTPGAMVWSNTGNFLLVDGTANSTLTTNNLSMTCALTSQRVSFSTTLGSAFTTSDTFTLTTGTVGLSSYTLTCNNVVNNSGSTRTLAFGTGKIVVAGSGVVYSQSVVTNLTYTGTPRVELSYSGATTCTINTSTSASAALAISVKTTGAGTYTLAQGAAGNFFMDLDFSGHNGPTPGGAYTVYGNYTLSSAASFSVTASASAITFAATSSKTITMNGYQVDRPLNFNGSGGTWVLQGALSVGPTATRVVTQTAGTLNLNGYTLTTPLYTTAAGTKNLTFNGGTLVVSGSGATALNNAAPTNFTTTAGTGVGTISMTSASAKTFVGGSSTQWVNATLRQAGAGALTITGSNTFYDITNTVTPCSIVFQASTTTTFSNGFNLNGTSGNLVTITSSTAGTQATLSKTSGTVSCNYLALKDSNATGGANWYAGPNSVNNGNDAGWVFNYPPAQISFAVSDPPDTAAMQVSATNDAALSATDPPDTVLIQFDVELVDGSYGANEYGLGTYTTRIEIDLSATEAKDTAAFDADVFTAMVLAATDAPDTVSISAVTANNLYLAATEAQDTASIEANCYTNIAASTGSVSTVNSSLRVIYYAYAKADTESLSTASNRVVLVYSVDASTVAISATTAFARFLWEPEPIISDIWTDQTTYDTVWTNISVPSETWTEAT